MNSRGASKLSVWTHADPLRLGFLPVSDCAPLVYAQEAGLFSKYDLRVELCRETRWNALRDKVIYGELDAAQTPAPLPFLANLGIDSDHCACVSGVVLSLQGNAITISRKLADEGVRDATALRERIYRHWGKRTFTFAVSHALSTQQYLLQQWLKSGGIVPEREVRIVEMPPAQMFPTLRLGYIDGYCVGEPWTSVAVEAQAGVCAATSAELAPMHPEKVLMVRQSFARGRTTEHERLISALLEACAWCDRPENREELGLLLARREFVNAPAECFDTGLTCRDGSAIGSPGLRPLGIFSGHGANDPTNEKAAWIIQMLYELLNRNALDRRSPDRTPVLKNIFRRDIFNRAQAVHLASRNGGAEGEVEQDELVASQKA